MAEVHNLEVHISGNGSCAIGFACVLFLEQASRARRARKLRRQLLARTSNQSRKSNFYNAPLIN